MRPPIATRAVAAALSVLTLAACGRHEERELTGWLKVDIVRPIGGTSGTIVVGQKREEFHVKVGNRWKRLGSGHPCRYAVLNDPNKEYYERSSQPAALVDLNDGKGMQIVREGEEALRRLQEVFGHAGNFGVPPSRTAIDFSSCRQGAPSAGCRDLQIDRYHPGGKLVATFHIPLGETYPECQLLGIRWYDSVETPMVDARCAKDSEPQCLWLTPRKEGLVVRAVGRDRPLSECSYPPSVNAALSEGGSFEVLY